MVNTIETLREYGALDYTTVVVAEASSLPGLQYLAPFAGCAIAEYWMQQGRDTLVVYDDLSHPCQDLSRTVPAAAPPARAAKPTPAISFPCMPGCWNAPPA